MLWFQDKTRCARTWECTLKWLDDPTRDELSSNSFQEAVSYKLGNPGHLSSRID